MFVWPCKNSLLSAMKISVTVVTELLCRKILRATMASLLLTSWAKGKPAWLPFPAFGEQISRDMLVTSLHEGWPPSFYVLGTTCKGLRTKLRFLMLIRSVVIIFIFSSLSYPTSLSALLPCPVGQDISYTTHSLLLNFLD